MKPNTAIQLATIMLRMTVRQQPHSSQSSLVVRKVIYAYLIVDRCKCGDTEPSEKEATVGMETTREKPPATN